jgi:predicted Zn-dependent peptidase
MVNRSKVTSLYADAFVAKDGGTFEFYAQLNPSASYSEIESILREELKKCADGFLTDEQLQVAKNGLLKDYYQSIISPASLARIIGDSFIFANDLGYSLRSLPLYDNVTKSDIARIAGQYLMNSHSTTIYLSPQR